MLYESPNYLPIECVVYSLY